MIKKMVLGISILVVMALSVPLLAGSRDAVEADPEHYSVEYENDKVRVIRIKYGPGEKSVMHTHGPNVSVMMTDGSVQFTSPDGTVTDVPMKAGNAVWSDREEHLPVNTGDQHFEGILIELKD